ncbi:hypothetical protein [Rhizobium sp. RM]|uniref:hypothetical protein n=1 Tax=Rhizobium sp. RM TaxID=2748079 RepID=UPI00110E5AED|nr:hypothetical protein [Rhizobium sp. RM]NWJ27228.1 hypothetical protein [Rhizobium sp. RM]TMV20291.1 hypothetical protein BJG94_09700 [Rhizobium sp. Td3]
MKRTFWLIFSMPIRAIIVIVSFIDVIFRPLYRPVVKAISSMTVFRRIEAQIARQARLVILLLLAVPFAIAEPMKVAGLVVMAHGHVVSGLTMVILAHLATFLIVERIYHAGRDKLLTYAWLAWGMRYVGMAKAFHDRIRIAVLNWLRLRVLLS